MTLTSPTDLSNLRAELARLQGLPVEHRAAEAVEAYSDIVRLVAAARGAYEALLGTQHADARRELCAALGPFVGV